MNRVHFVLQGKGGCGKSFISKILAQYIAERNNQLPLCFDTDQENPTFYSAKALGAKHVKVMNSDRMFERKLFDPMIEEIITANNDVVIDTGANTFSPMVSYMISSDLISLLRSCDKEVVIHTVIAGGDNLKDTVEGYMDLISQLDCNFILYLNEHFGSARSFLESKAYKTTKEKLDGIVVLHKSSNDLIGDDLSRMNSDSLTFNEVSPGAVSRTGEKYGVVCAQRLKNYKEALFATLDENIVWYQTTAA